MANIIIGTYATIGTVSETPYNHYTMLGSVENLFGLAHLGYAAPPSETYFGADVFSNEAAWSARSAVIYRTARRLMQGAVGAPVSSTAARASSS